jgi:hypothetical protein
MLDLTELDVAAILTAIVAASFLAVAWFLRIQAKEE